MCFFMVDDGSSNLLHFIFACLLIEMDFEKKIPADIIVKSSNGC